jgi:hypothetical protein
MKFWYCWLLAAALCFTGCGRQERREAVSFYKVLSQKGADFAATNALEKDLLGSTKAWCEGITSNGAGRGKQLEENTDSATALSQSAALVSVQLGQFRQALNDQPLKQENVQSVRGNLMKQIMTRQKMLQEVRTALDSSAADFKAFAQSRAYIGDTYPAGIDKLTSMLERYKGPDDVIARAIVDLKAKYKIAAADLGG